MFIEIKFTEEKDVLQALNSKFSKSEINLFNSLLDLERLQGRVVTPIKFLSDLIKCDERTVQRGLAKFVRLGLIKKFQRHLYSWNTIIINSSIYQFARYFKYKFSSLYTYLDVKYLRPFRKNVTPLEEEDVVILPRKSIVVDNQSQKNIKRGNFLTKREDMEISPPNISPTLREITNRIGLTKLGQLKLLVIPEDILSSVWSHFKKQAGVNKPFEWILANCLRRCENLGIAISWELFYLSVKRYGLVDNKIYVSKINKVEKKVIESSRSVDNIIRPYQDKTEPHPKFAQFYFQAMDNTSKS